VGKSGESSRSVAGSEITYSPLAHAPRSAIRQRSLQKGNWRSVVESVGLRQMGQRQRIADSRLA
jgi:hypothetical protein